VIQQLRTYQNILRQVPSFSFNYVLTVGHQHIPNMEQYLARRDLMFRESRVPGVTSNIKNQTDVNRWNHFEETEKVCSAQKPRSSAPNPPGIAQGKL
jgi:hypothetical protein